jgi:hypothetical protein
MSGSSSFNGGSSTFSAGSGSGTGSGPLWTEATFLQTVPAFLRDDPEVRGVAALFRLETAGLLRTQEELRRKTAAVNQQFGSGRVGFGG